MVLWPVRLAKSTAVMSQWLFPSLYSVMEWPALTDSNIENVHKAKNMDLWGGNVAFGRPPLSQISINTLASL